MVRDMRRWRGPGQAVRAQHPEGGVYWAWVPDPLPPRIDFDSQLASDLADAAGALGQLAGAGSNLANPLLLLNPFLRREAVLSSRIEGTQATITDLYAYEAQLPLPGMAEQKKPSAGQARHGDAWEVLNYVTALDRGIEAIESYPVSLSLIQQLHRHLMRGVRGRDKTPGEFRDGQNAIGSEGATLETATYIPPPPIQMHDALRDFESYVRQDDQALHYLVRLAAIHYQFEAIHPFNDGNGRVGRLLISLLIVHWGLLPLPLLYLSAYLERRRDEYYSLLQGVTERGAWREWASFFLKGVAQQSTDATIRARRLHEVRGQLETTALSAKVPAGALALATRLLERPILTIAAARAMLGEDASYHYARRQVHRLLDLGILQPFATEGHQEYYIAPDVMNAVEEDVS